MAQWVAVHGYGAENLEPDVLNRPVRELTERTNWLYEQLQSLLGSGTFESVRILNAALETESEYAPSVGDFVQLDRTTRTYAQALASVSDEDVFTADPQAYAVGLLVHVNSDNTGTIVLYGKADLSTSGAGWDLSGMVETGVEVYRNGTYYLSTAEAGKMTATPAGIAIYLGQFQDSAASPGYGGSVLLNPQYRDTGEAHIHRAYPLYDQVAGFNYTDGVLPTSVHSVLGFDPEVAATGADVIPRMVALGAWTGGAATQYTIWLSGSSDPNETLAASADPANAWGSVYIHWTSSDPNEDSGATLVWAFETPRAVGTKGLMCSLEQMTGQPNDEPFNPLAGVDPDKRTWILTVPDMTRGWLARKTRLYLDDHPATDNGFSLMLKGGPHTSTDSRPYETVTAKSGDFHNIVYTGQPNAGETIVISGTTFEFYTTTYAGTDEGVAIGVDADTTYQNLLAAILAANITGCDAALSTANNALVVVLPTGTGITSSTAANVTVPLVASYTGSGDLSAGTVGLLVYDQYNHCLVDSATPYWTGIDYWEEVALTNGLTLMVLPYDDDGTAASANTVVAGDYWDVTFVDEAPGANFDYALGMHPALSQYYPPIPRNAATLVMNGVELSAYNIFPANADYAVGLATISWFNNGYGGVPWPRDWVSVASPGSDVYQQQLLFHLVRMAAGNTGLVTSLRSSTGSPIKVLQCGTTEPATTGDLELDLDLNLEIEDANLAGWRAVKSISGQKLRRGPVVEKILPGSGIDISSSAGAPAGQGIVTISTSTNAYAGEFETVALENAKQDVIGMFPYIRLLGWTTGDTNNTPTAFIGKFRVPHNIAPSAEFRVVVYATVFGEQEIPWIGGGSILYAGLAFEYSILPDYTNVITGGETAWGSLDETLPDGMMTMSTPVTGEVPFGKYDAGDPSQPIYKAYDPLLVHNDDTLTDTDRRQAQIFGGPFPVRAALSGWTDPADPVVRAGSLVGIRISRSDVLSVGQEYTGAVGFINLRWKLVSV
jgi:hypothetical protein